MACIRDQNSGGVRCDPLLAILLTIPNSGGDAVFRKILRDRVPLREIGYLPRVKRKTGIWTAQ